LLTEKVKTMMLPTRTLYYEDLSIGLTESYEKEVKSSDVVGFAEITGDRNPIHLSEHFAAKTPFGGRIAHGLYTASLISAVIGTRLPGPGAIYLSQTLNFKAPVKIGDVVSASVEVAELVGKIDLPLPGGRYLGAGRRSIGEGAYPVAVN
jgi:3-hydroxybutyryl-CoA dehydratase